MGGTTITEIMAAVVSMENLATRSWIPTAHMRSAATKVLRTGWTTIGSLERHIHPITKVEEDTAQGGLSLSIYRNRSSYSQRNFILELGSIATSTISREWEWEPLVHQAMVHQAVSEAQWAWDHLPRAMVTATDWWTPSIPTEMRIHTVQMGARIRDFLVGTTMVVILHWQTLLCPLIRWVLWIPRFLLI